MTPAQVAQMLGVSESDVDREPRRGRPQGPQDRHAVAHHARRGRQLPQGMSMASKATRPAPRAGRARGCRAIACALPALAQDPRCNEAVRRRARLARARSTSTTPRQLYAASGKRFREGDVRRSSGPGRREAGARAVRRGEAPDAARCASRRRIRRDRAARATSWSSCSAPTFDKRGRTAPRSLTLEREADGKWRVIGYLMQIMGQSALTETVGASEVRVSGVRRRGDLESRASRSSSARSAAPSRPAKLDRRHGRDRRARSRRGAARHRRRGARLEGRQAAGQVPELQRDLGVRSRAAGAELRVLRLGAARALRGDEARVPAGERAAVRGQRAAARATASAQWYGKLWLAPNALKRRALTDTVKGIYLPYWTFDAQADAQWTAEAGHYYYTTETYAEGGQTRTRQVQHVRWEPAAGRLSHFFDDDLVCASVGVHPGAAARHRAVSDADAEAVRPGLRRGLGRRALPDRPRRRARSARARRWTPRCAQMCAQQVPGDTYRNLVVHTSYSRQTFKHILAPVWLMSLHLRRTRVPVRAERRHRRDRRRVSEEPVEDRADRARAVHRRGHRAVRGRALRGRPRDASTSPLDLRDGVVELRGRGDDGVRAGKLLARSVAPEHADRARAVHARGANVVRAIADQDGGFGVEAFASRGVREKPRPCRRARRRGRRRTRAARASDSPNSVTMRRAKISGLEVHTNTGPTAAASARASPRCRRKSRSPAIRRRRSAPGRARWRARSPRGRACRAATRTTRASGGPTQRRSDVGAPADSMPIAASACAIEREMPG